MVNIIVNMYEQNGGYPVDADGYMEQEEEWEREGLLDPAWEKQQKKVSVKKSVYYIILHKTTNSTQLSTRSFAIQFFLARYFAHNSLQICECIHQKIM